MSKQKHSAIASEELGAIILLKNSGKNLFCAFASHLCTLLSAKCFQKSYVIVHLSDAVFCKSDESWEN